MGMKIITNEEKGRRKMLVGKEASKNNPKSMKAINNIGFLRTYLLMEELKFVSLFFNL